MTVSEKKAIVLGKKVGKLFGQEKAVLIKAGINADLAQAETNALVEEVVTLDAHQESLKRQLKATTSALEAARAKLYIRSSGWLDTAIAAVDKNSAAARNFRKIRTELRHERRKTSPEQAVEAAPAQR